MITLTGHLDLTREAVEAVAWGGERWPSARLGNLLSGHAGVSPELCRFLADRVNDGFVPAVPRRGAGSPGEVVPLAHAFQPRAGAGLVLGPEESVQDAGAALAERGVLPTARPAAAALRRGSRARAPGRECAGRGRRYAYCHALRCRDVP